MNKKPLLFLKKLESKIPLGTCTLLLVSLIALSYLLLSPNYLFIPNSAIMKFGFLPQGLISSFLGVFTYSFIHISPQHILANVSLLLAVGIIAEQKLRPRDYLSIFFASAITAGVVFHLLSPKPTILIGASSAVSGILAASVFVDFKKAIPAIVIFALFLSVASPMVSSYTASKLGLLENETQKLEKEFNETLKEEEKVEEELNQTLSRLQVLKIECHEEDNETACDELNKTVEEKENKTQEKKQIEEERNKTQEDLNGTMQKKNVVKEGVKREEETTTSSVVHLVGALTGLIYLGLFRRDIIWNLPSQASQLEDYFKK